LVDVPYAAHPDRRIPDLKTEIRAINFKQDPKAVKAGDRVRLGNSQVPVVYMGGKKGFADALQKEIVDLKSPGLAYLAAGESDPRLAKYRGITTGATWILIDTPFFHPLKGPMLTLPLQGIAHSGALHFRGDMQGGEPAGSNHCPNGKSVEERALREFNAPCEGGEGTFEGLLGGKRLPEHEMDWLVRYVFALSYPPNPIRALNNGTNAAGERIFFTQKMGADVTDYSVIYTKEPLIFTCVQCHATDRRAQQFGTSQKMYSAPALTLQDAKIPHLRFLYDRVGFFRGDYRKANASVQRAGWRSKLKKTLYDRFGFFKDEFDSAPTYLAVQPLEYYDELVHAIGYNHGGWFDDTMFATSVVWILNGEDPDRKSAETLRRYEDLFEFLMGFDTDFFPMFGQQFTFGTAELSAIKAGSAAGAALLDRFRVFVAAAYSPHGYSAPQCHLSYDATPRRGQARPQSIRTKSELDIGSREALAARLLSLRPDLQPITFTCG